MLMMYPYPMFSLEYGNIFMFPIAFFASNQGFTRLVESITLPELDI